MTSYATYRPDLSEARLLSIAHRKAVELNASQQAGTHSDPPQVHCAAIPPTYLLLSMHIHTMHVR